jgi:endoglucanase
MHDKKPHASIMSVLILVLICLTASCAGGSSSADYDIPFSDTPIAEQESPVALNGNLSVSGTHIVNEDGEPVQFKGMSLFWSQWGGKYYNENAIAHTRTYWNASIVRAAMGINGEANGYLVDPVAEKQKVIDAVDAAVNLGIYVIIDWHDHSAHDHTTEAKAFFAEMADRYKNTPNVLFEIFNEPLDTTTWAVVKEYSLEVIQAIRDEGANNIIIVGSPRWSQNVKDAAADPITGYENIAYSLHFYAASHGQWLRDDADSAMASGLALVVTEWGTCDASGNSNFSPTESDKWITWMDENKISWCNWSLNDKEETASALRLDANEDGGWTQDDFTPSGLYVINKMREGGIFVE